jgi:hypothetical protein
MKWDDKDEQDRNIRAREREEGQQNPHEILDDVNPA